MISPVLSVEARGFAEEEGLMESLDSMIAIACRHFAVIGPPSVSLEPGDSDSESPSLLIVVDVADDPREVADAHWRFARECVEVLGFGSGRDRIHLIRNIVDGHRGSEMPMTVAYVPARARQLDDLSAYVRLLADRMGLKDWEAGARWLKDEMSTRIDPIMTMRDDEKWFKVVVTPAFFDLGPEERRLKLVREIARLHFNPMFNYLDEDTLDDSDFWVLANGGINAVAAAWAPRLPLPLVGLMACAPAAPEGIR